MSARQTILGLLLCEVGNMSDLLSDAGKLQLQAVITSAFQDAGATKHGDPRFFWNQGETLAVFKAEVQVRALEPLTNIANIDAWRIAERFELIGAT